MLINDHLQKTKCAKRIVRYSEIYKNDFEELMKQELVQLKKLELKLFIALKIKFAYKKRHKQ